MVQNRVALFLILISMVGCAGNSGIVSAKDAPGIKILTLTAKYVDQDFKPTERPDEPKEIYLEMPLIPGALSGSVLTESIININAQIGEAFTIDLSDYQEIIDQYATPLLHTNFTRGITIKPASRRLVRIGTFAYHPHTHQFLGPTGLRDLKTPDQIQLFLMYFDGPAVITGTGQENKTTISYNIEVKNKGYIWLEVDRTGKNSLVVTNRHSKNKITLTIQAPLKPTTKV